MACPFSVQKLDSSELDAEFVITSVVLYNVSNTTLLHNIMRHPYYN